MKLGVVGKGGVGKTTLSALIAQAYATSDRRVVAIDTDSNPNLGMSLGLTMAETDAVPLIPRAMAIGLGGDLTAHELLEEYGCVTPSGVTLMSAMRVTQAGGGCMCGSHATVRSILSAAIDDEADVTLIDMEAGLEHLSRAGGTLAFADVLLMVMEPSRKSILTAARTQALATELGLPRTYGVGNKVRIPEDADFFAEVCGEYGVALAGVVPYDDGIVEAECSGGGLGPDDAAPVRQAVSDLVSFIDRALETPGRTQPERTARIS